MKKLLFLLSMLLITGTSFAQNPVSPSMDEGSAALKTLLLSEELQNIFKGEGVIFILSTEQTCSQVICQPFELKAGGQKVFFYTKEDLFMRAAKKWLEINKVYYNEVNQVIIDYTIR